MLLRNRLDVGIIDVPDFGVRERKGGPVIAPQLKGRPSLDES